MLVRKLLGLRSDLQEFKIIYGGLSGNDNVVAVQTRSAFQILNLLGSNVEVPPEHIADRRTYPPIPESANMTRSMPRLSGFMQKSRARQMPSRRSSIAITGIGLTTATSGQKGFSFLMIMMTLADKEDEAQPPVVTIQGN